MANLLACEIVTPDAHLFTGEAVLVSAPAAQGEIGFMYRCSPRMCTLRRGIVRVKNEKDEVTRFAVDGGYLEVDGRKVVILASRAIDFTLVKKETANERIAANEKRVGELAQDDPARAFAEAEISWQQYLLNKL